MNKNRVDTYMEDNPFEQLSDVFFNLLAEDISTLTLKPGAKLNISKISEELEVSRTPVREAAMKLFEAGYIEKILDKPGYYVADMSIADIKKIYLIRIIIETKAAFICAKFKSYPEYGNLKKSVDNVKELYNNADKITDNDYNFHKQLVLSCGNEYLVEFYNMIENKMRRMMKSNYNFLIKNNQIDEIDKIATEHKTILNAIEQNMPEMAERAMLGHINEALNNSSLFMTSPAFDL